MIEIWKPLPKYEKLYEISNMGRVRSLDAMIFNKGNNQHCKKKGQILKLCEAKNGYMVVNIKRTTKYVHRLVAKAFIDSIPPKMTINHKDGNKTNNKVSNLEIVSYSDNHLHAFEILKRKPTCLGKTNTNVSKPVRQIDSKGNKINDYPSAREAERQTGISHKNISQCCHKERLYAKGYQWEFI